MIRSALLMLALTHPVLEQAVHDNVLLIIGDDLGVDRSADVSLNLLNDDLDSDIGETTDLLNAPLGTRAQQALDALLAARAELLQ